MGNISVLAQKEFADNYNSPKIRMLTLVLILMVLSYSILAGKNGNNIFERGFLDVNQVIGLFFPIIGITIGFDAILKERNSHSLNILLTHPVFRDNVIAGKIVGGLATILIVIFISVIISVGIILILTGVQVGGIELKRILIFAVITFVYLATYFALGLLLSIVSKDPAESFIYGIVIWIVFVLIFGATTAIIASIVTGEPIMNFEHNDDAKKLYMDLQAFSPTNHYCRITTGLNGFSQGNINFATVDQKSSSGIFDLSHSLNQWTKDYWTNILVLIVTPIILFIMSFIVFMNKDITR